MKSILLLLILFTFKTFAGVCCNPGGQQVPSMNLCAGSPNVDGSPCCNRPGNQPGGNSQQPITWYTGSSCGQNNGGSDPSSTQNCCVNLPTQNEPTNCQALAAELIATNSLTATELANRCNQIWQGQACEWKCSGTNTKPTPASGKKVKLRKK